MLYRSLQQLALITGSVLALSGCFHEGLLENNDCSTTNNPFSVNATSNDSKECEKEATTDGELTTQPVNSGGISENTESSGTGGNTNSTTPNNTSTAFVPEAGVYYKLQTLFLENDNKCLEGNKLGAGSTLGGAAFMDTCQNVSGQYWKFIAEKNGYFRLQTMFLEDEDRCLESNKHATNATLKGASFMDRCQDVSGQYWKIIPDELNTGYYRLTSMFLEDDDKCLEGNLLASTSTLEGAAFMDNCQNVSGQLWTFVKTTANKQAPVQNVKNAFVPAADKYYRLKTLFLRDENKCLEGNRFDPGSTLKGAAFMDSCKNVTGQYWRFIDQGNGYYKMTTMFQEGDDKCLEGNKFGENSTLGGAAFLDNCGNFSGQSWKIVPDASGYHKLQTQFLEKENQCLEGNRFDPSSTLEGAAFMDACQNVSGQLWIFEEV